MQKLCLLLYIIKVFNREIRLAQIFRRFFKKFVTHVQTRYDYMYFVHLNLKKIIVDFFKSLYLDSALSVNAIKFDKNIFISLDVHVPVT